MFTPLILCFKENSNHVFFVKHSIMESTEITLMYFTKQCHMHVACIFVINHAGHSLGVGEVNKLACDWSFFIFFCCHFFLSLCPSAENAWFVFCWIHHIKYEDLHSNEHIYKCIESPEVMWQWNEWLVGVHVLEQVIMASVPWEAAHCYVTHRGVWYSWFGNDPLDEDTPLILSHTHPWCVV